MNRKVILTSLLSLALCGCSAPASKSASVDVISELKDLAGNPPVSQVQNTFTDLLLQTAEYFNRTLRVDQNISLTEAIVSGDTLQARDNSQTCSTSYLMDNNSRLFEIINASATADSSAYIGLVSMDESSTITLDCSQQADGNLLLNTLTSQKNAAIEGVNENELANALLSEEITSLAYLVGSSLDQPIQQTPYWYTFSLAETSVGYEFTISLKDSDGYNKSWNETWPDGDENGLKRELTSLTYTLTLNAQGAILSSQASRTETVTWNGQSLECAFSREDRLSQISDASSQISALTDVFNDVARQEVKEGSSFAFSIQP